VGWFSDLLFGPGGGGGPLAVASGRAIGTDLLSPWADNSHLARVAFSEIFSASSDIVDRGAAMRVAPIKRGRAIIVGSISDLPLVSGRFDGDTFTPTDRQPAWLASTKMVSSTWHRMANTVDDLIFSGWSLWALQRSAAGTILDAVRVPLSRWSFDQNAGVGIRVDDKPVEDAASVILFAGPDEGLLATGTEVIRGARAMEEAWVGRVRNPVPMTVLHEVSDGGTRVTPEQAKTYVDAWSAARRSADGAVGFLPHNLNMEVYGETVADLFTEGRNNVRLDVANLLNLPASVLDGSTATASLTYQTAQGEFSQLASWLEYWLAPIEARLSMDDITPHGQVIRFNRGDLTKNQPYGSTLIAGAEPEPTPEVAS
jgi:hypothetical protein